MRAILTFLMLACAGLTLFSQTDGRIAHTKTPLSGVEQVTMPQQDNEALLAAELERRGPGIAPRFAVNLETNISPATHGTWDYLANGNAVWRLRIRSAGAKSLNLGFTKYVMPHGGTLVLYSPGYERVMGPFTPAGNEEHEQLWTPVLNGDELVVEVQLPQVAVPALQLQLKYVNHDFLGFAEMLSGSCNLDVICGGADGWDIVDHYRDIIQSVAVIGTGGSTFCTGFLVNNTRQDCTPYFMTAYHCGITQGSAPSLVAYWNFENSTCRQPNSPQSGGPGNGTLSDFNTGATFKAGWSNSDFTLVEFDDPISETADAFFAGWSAEDTAPSDTVVCIHHPSTDEKRISFEFDPTHIGAWGSGGDPVPNGNHIIIPDWDVGTTEGGSSGSPLFDNQKRVVGQLHGGGAACGNSQYDSYGWFYFSWEGGGTPATRLKDWLDPDNSGVIVLDGHSQMQCNFFVEGTPANIELCAPDEAAYTVSVSETFVDSVVLSVTGLPDSLTATFDTNPVPPGGSTMLIIGNTAAVSGGTYTFSLAGADSTDAGQSDLTLFVAHAAPAPVTLASPADDASGLGLSIIYSWGAATNTSYEIEVSTDTSFANVVESSTGLTGGTYQSGAGLQTQTTYHWRVKATNVCGEGDWSEVYSFTTGAIFCGPLTSANVPVVISSSGTPVITSTLEVTYGGFADDLNLTNLDIQHTWVGDLRVELTSPQGTTITLMANPGNGNCGENNLLVTFDDEAADDYSVLDNSCNTGGLAIEGSFQPFESLSAFNGEWMEGTWILTVYDDAAQDGGTLVGWGLDVCATVPDDFSVLTFTDAVEGCVNDSVFFTVLPGTAFNDSAGVTLSANNLPAGATAIFDPNPAMPGTEIQVALIGTTAPGSYSIDIVANDGTNTGTATVTWTIGGAPAAPTLIAPASNATGVSVNPVVGWQAVPGASYQIQIAADAGMSDVVFSTASGNTSVVVNGLDYCTTYYWQVTAVGDCGQSVSEVSAFTTELDLAFNASPGTLTSCNFGTVSGTLTLGECFDAAGVTLSAPGLPANATIAFASNPAQPGSYVSFDLTLDDVVPGTYTVTLEGNDGTNAATETFNLTVTGPAPAPAITYPPDASIIPEDPPTFIWEAVSGALNYKIEVATDDNFTAIIADTTTDQTAFTPVSSLVDLNNIFYWRVTAFNDCGGTTPSPFSFEIFSDGTREIFGVEILVQPNPTNGVVRVNLREALQMPLEVTVFASNGVQLQRKKIAGGAFAASLDLSNYPAGVYLLRLSAGAKVATERIVLEK
jgi:subtilisin-like proprotein convertase family protein